MKKTKCVVHNTYHPGQSSWRYTQWDTENGIVTGWGCADDVKYPEFTSQSIKNERLTHANDMLQSHRRGELSREFIEAHPQQAKQMLKNGAITKEDVKRSKYVWRGDVPGVTKKVDAESLLK